MNEATDKLIGRLVAEAAPVRRLRPPLVRAALWLLAVAAVGAILIFALSDLATFERRAEDPKLVLELIGTLATGIAAVIAAFYLSLPDRSDAWALLPLPPLALWIASSGYSCYRHWITFGPDGWELGESGDCFRFIVAVSVPLGIALFLLLRQARPIAPVRVAATGGLGVAGLAAFLLQFFHPFDVTLIDLASHLAAVGLVVAVSSFAGRRWRAA
ncbi:MAG TPA: NrsF family protein [Alphaproteobacteria bacterium]|nr:NrsF family protein [Alphaproteobacteria bacterium]